MKDFIIGFFMAWGNFLTLPCPYKRWDNGLKNMMLAFLPGVGMVAGLLWFILGCIVLKIAVYPLLSALLICFFIYAICGFMHMDGFMDVNDAIMSRRPLEDRLRILKDSTVGAFAVITVMFLVLAMYVASLSFFIKPMEISGLFPLLTIPVISRGTAGVCVLSFKPLTTSQYLEDHEKPRDKYIKMVALITCAYFLLILVLAIIFARPEAIARLVVSSLGTSCVTLLSCLYARHNLGGMNGDIAGYSICMGELGGMILAALIIV